MSRKVQVAQYKPMQYEPIVVFAHQAHIHSNLVHVPTCPQVNIDTNAHNCMTIHHLMMMMTIRRLYFQCSVHSHYTKVWPTKC